MFFVVDFFEYFVEDIEWFEMISFWVLIIYWFNVLILIVSSIVILKRYMYILIFVKIFYKILL